MKKFLALFAFLAALGFHCQILGDQPYQVEITFLSPTKNQIFKTGDSVPVHVEFVQPDGELLYGVKVELLAQKDSLLQILKEKQLETWLNFAWKPDSAFVASVPGVFKIRATATDSLGKRAGLAERNFSVAD